MDETKEKDRDIPVGSVSGSTVTESEHVAGETLVGSGQVQGQIEGSFNEGLEGHESCHGDDIMVEVLGSDVYVGGVCTSGSGENLDDENGGGAIMDFEVVSERPVNPIVGDGGAVDGSDSQGDAGVPGGEAFNQGTATENEGVTREVSSGGVVAEGTDRETEVNHVGDVDMVPREEGVEGEMHKVDVSTGGEAVAGGNEAHDGVSKQEVEVRDEKARDPSTENEVEGPLVVMESVDSENGVAVEADDKVAGGADDALNDTDEALNSGIEIVSTTTVENSSLETEVHEEKSEATGHEEGLNPKVLVDKPSHDTGAGEVGGVDKEVLVSSKVVVLENDALGENSHLVEKEQVKIEIGGSSTQNHINVSPDSESSHQQTLVVVESEVSVTESKVVSVSQQDGNLNTEDYFDNNMSCDIQIESNVEQAMEIDGQAKDAEQVDSDGGHKKVLVSNTEVPGPAERLKSEKNSEKSATCDVSPVCASTVHEILVVEKTTDAQRHSLHAGQEIESEKQHETSEKVGGVIENDDHVWADVTTLGQPTLVVHAEVVTPSDSVLNSVDKAVLLLPSGNDKNSQTETTCSTETENKVTEDANIAPMDTEEVSISTAEVPGHSDNNQKLNSEECLQEGVATDCGMSDRDFVDEVDVKEQVTIADDFGLHREQDLAAVKEVEDTEQPNIGEENIAKWQSLEPESSSVVNQPSYELPLEDEGVFSVPNLVWGKVKSHPWWPGQIFDFTDASEKAMKHHKRDCFLVAYFGDRTFAWNEASSLKPFRTHFSQMEKQGNAESFQNAVDSALEEVSRRVELGLACSCIPKYSRDNIQFQIVENAGIRPESSRRDGMDESASASFFQANKLLEYVKALAQFPSVESNRLEVVIAKAQLLSFCRFKGFCSLPEFQFSEGLVENNIIGSRFQDSTHPGEGFEDASPFPKDDEQTSSSQEMLKLQNSSSHKRKHNLRGGAYPKLKEKSLSELMVDGIDSLDEDNWSGRRRNGADYHGEDLTTQDGRKTISVAKVSNSSAFPKQSFKIGECIRRVASQLTGSPPTIKIERVKVDGSGDRPRDGYDISFQSSEDIQRGKVDAHRGREDAHKGREDAHKGRVIDPGEYSSLDELLLQLQFIAQDPLKEYNFSNVIINFFSDFRNSVIGGQYSGTELASMDKASGKRKKGPPETFEFDDMNDTYWTDRVIQNGTEEQPPRRGRKKDNQLGSGQAEKPHQESRRTYSRKRYSNGDNALTPEKPAGYVSENAPAELIMNFSEVKCMPSETNLNKMFRRFGPLKEMETEVDRESSRARVVFKKTSDAEVACSSAGKFNIFGPTPVNYQLSYAPTLPFKASPVVTTQDHEMQLNLSAHDHEMQLDLSSHEHEMQLDLSTHDHDMQLDLSSLSNFEVNLV
ncbi:PWWP domain containing protein [Trema orientale]|uniref:PWWP domain containing protein n=1 Tax=Trema orientale TaxID=63057 RepID=A0A2P5CTF4_TREOI|nr:PWWP domain containing protein [Trema orientale]